MHLGPVLAGLTSSVSVTSSPIFELLRAAALTGTRRRVDGVVTEPRPPQGRTCASNASGSSHDSFAQGWAACRRTWAGGSGCSRRMSFIRSQVTRPRRWRRESHFLQVWVTS